MMVWMSGPLTDLKTDVHSNNKLWNIQTNSVFSPFYFLHLSSLGRNAAAPRRLTFPPRHASMTRYGQER